MITIDLFKAQSERIFELSKWTLALRFSRIFCLVHLNDESELYIKLK